MPKLVADKKSRNKNVIYFSVIVALIFISLLIVVIRMRGGLDVLFVTPGTVRVGLEATANPINTGQTSTVSLKITQPSTFDSNGVIFAVRVPNPLVVSNAQYGSVLNSADVITFSNPQDMVVAKTGYTEIRIAAASNKWDRTVTPAVYLPFTLNANDVLATFDISSPSATSQNITLLIDPNQSPPAYPWVVDQNSNDVLDSTFPTLSITVNAVAALPAPTLNPASGNFSDVTSINVANAATYPAGTTLRYTINGGTPVDINPSQVISIDGGNSSGAAVLDIYAFASGYSDSPSTNATYNFKAADPVYSPVPGTYSGSVLVNATTATNLANIIYTTDGTDPTGSAGGTVNITSLNILAGNSQADYSVVSNGLQPGAAVYGDRAFTFQTIPTY